MSINEILTQYNSGELSKAPDLTLLATQNKLDRTVDDMRKQKVNGIAMETIHPANGQLIDLWIRIEKLDSISNSISNWLYTRYGCND